MIANGLKLLSPACSDIQYIYEGKRLYRCRRGTNAANSIADPAEKISTGV